MDGSTKNIVYIFINSALTGRYTRVHSMSTVRRRYARDMPELRYDDSYYNYIVIFVQISGVEYMECTLVNRQTLYIIASLTIFIIQYNKIVVARFRNLFFSVRVYLEKAFFGFKYKMHPPFIYSNNIIFLSLSKVFLLRACWKKVI